MFHNIFDYNYGNSWYIFNYFDNVCTIRKRNEYSTKQIQTVSLLPGKTKNNTKTGDRLLHYVLLNRSLLFVRQFFQQSSDK